jgi:dolichol-phosphate mannosyltransferase
VVWRKQQNIQRWFGGRSLPEASSLKRVAPRFTPDTAELRDPNNESMFELAIVLPTYNERDNIPLIIARLTETLRGVNWEAIFVDDDSPDGTAEVVAAFARQDRRIRLLHRIGQRGLASACIDGMLATMAPAIAIMDADLQHDETILPRMLARLRDESLDVIVATRNSEGGSMGEFGQRRVMLSRVGQKIGHTVCRCRISDPMSGFFMLRRSVVKDVTPRLHRGGFKILVDILASSRQPVRVGEIGYTFGARCNGESKLDVFVGVEYLLLIFSKLLGGILPTRIGLFALVGGLGVITYMLSLLGLTQLDRMHFVQAQLVASLIAMTGNFFCNNVITFSDRRLRGTQMLAGLARFVTACSFAACGNVLFARWLWQTGVPWYGAGLAGIILGSLWNLTVSSHFTWGIQRHNLRDAGPSAAFATDLEVSR